MIDRTALPGRENSRLALGLAYIEARLRKSELRGLPCVQSQAFQSDQQTVPAAVLPQENVLTAHLPLTTKTGSLVPLSASMSTSLEQLCIILQDLAMSGCVSDTQPITCAPVLISFDDYSAPSTANNGSTPRWTDAQNLGGPNSKERGKLLLLSEERKRRDLCGNS